MAYAVFSVTNDVVRHAELPVTKKQFAVGCAVSNRGHAGLLTSRKQGTL